MFIQCIYFHNVGSLGSFLAAVFPMNFAKFLRTPFFHRTPLMAASDTRI